MSLPGSTKAFDLYWKVITSLDADLVLFINCSCGPGVIIMEFHRGFQLIIIEGCVAARIIAFETGDYKRRRFSTQFI